MGATGSPLSRAVTDQEAVETLNALEAQEGLFEHRVGEWCAWPLLKTEVMMKLTGLRFSSKGRPPSASWRVRTAAADSLKLLRADRSDILIKTGTATVVDRVGAKYKDFLFDDLALALPSVQKIETVIDETHLARRESALCPATLTTALPEIAAGLLWRSSSPQRHQEVARQLSAALEGKLGLAECTWDWASIRLRHFDATRRAYRVLLRRMCGKVLLVGDPGEYAAVAAATELGLATVELQHGLLNAYHPAYAWGSAPERLWPRIPVSGKLFAFGRYWRETLAEIPFWRDRVEVVGSLRMDAYRDLRRTGPRPGRLAVFTTQGIDTARAMAFVKCAREKQLRRGETSLVVKLHPAWEASKEEYVEAFRGDCGVEVQLASEGPNTLELLIRADIHLSISSFCHYEACALGVNTVVLPFKTSESLAPMVSAGHAVRAESSDKLARILDGEATGANVTVAADYYFQQDALSRMRAMLMTVS